MLKSIRLVKYILPLLILLIVLSYVYLISFHRVVGVNDIRSVLSVANKPTVNSRCKAFNETHYYCLPNVLFIGASKCGTTSMVDYLSQHPSIRFVSRRIHKKDHHREVHRFDRNSFGYAMKTIDLLDEWASSPLLDNVNTTLVHYTPHYLYAPTVPYDVKKFYPHSSELKFIVMLRDPVERALSSYWFQNSHLLNDADKGSIEEFISLSSAEINDRRLYEQCMRISLSVPSSSGLIEYMSLLTNHSVASHDKGNSQLYQALVKCFGSDLRSKTLGHRHIDKGIYVDQVLRWLDNFRMDQFLFISLKDMHARPQETFQKVLDFMEVIPSDGRIERLPGELDPIVSTIEFGRVRLQKPNMFTADVPDYFKKILYEYFAPYNEMLSSLLRLHVNL